MDRNIYDRVLERMDDIISKASLNISEKFKGSNPFDKQKIPMEEQIYEYKTMDDASLREKIDKYGIDEVERWMEKVEQAMQRRGLNA